MKLLLFSLYVLLAVVVFLLRKRSLGKALHYAILLRFPLLGALALVVLAPVALLTPAKTLFGNLFVLEEFEFFWVSLVAVLVAWALLVSGQLIFRYIHHRVGSLKSPPALPDGFRRHRVFFGFFLAAWVILGALITSSREAAILDPSDGSFHLLVALLWTVAGGLAAYLVLLGATVIRELMVEPNGPLDLVFDSERTPWRKVFDWAREKRVSGRGSKLWRKAAEMYAGLVAILGPGYLRDGRGDSPTLWPGHLFATVLFVLTFVVYVVIAVLFAPTMPLHPFFPALGYVLLLLLILAWVLPALSFWLDRWRVPTLTFVVVASLIFYSISAMDHYFLLEKTARGNGSLAAENALDPWKGNSDVVFVAASGGGITASAWTAEVLTRLEEEFGSELTSRIATISSVSGGSVGTMYYLTGFEASQPRSADHLEAVRRASSASSLRATAWGLAYPDLWRFLVSPVVGWILSDRPEVDRGWAMEESWRQALADLEDELELEPDKRRSKVLDWNQDLVHGNKPVPLLNSFVIETGRPLLVTPVELPTSRFSNYESFHELYEGYDLAIPTAARLSAIFPWVTPIARPAPGVDLAQGVEGYHLGDGGYYDNFGIATLVEWIEEVLGPPTSIRRLLVLEIRASAPDDGGDLMVAGDEGCRWKSDEEKKKPGVQERGWAYATFGPLQGLLSARSTSQIGRNDAALDLVRSRWRQERAGQPQPVRANEDLQQEIEERLEDRVAGIEVEVATFSLRAESPLSWRLSPREKDLVSCGWKPYQDLEVACEKEAGRAARKAFASVASFLGKEAEECPSVEPSLARVEGRASR